MFYKSVNLFYEPEMVCNQITYNKSEKYYDMTTYDKDFLCVLLKEKRPKKLPEPGAPGPGPPALKKPRPHLPPRPGGRRKYIRLT